MPPPDLENISGAPIGGGQVQTLRPLTRDLPTGCQLSDAAADLRS